MLDNAPFLSHTHKAFTIEGYSRAAVQTYWRIPELKLGFDLGAHPWDFMGTPNWFISHCHLDHIAAIPSFVARRRMMKMEPPTIYVPESGVAAINALLRCFSKLDRGRLPCNLIGVQPGQEFELSRELVVTTAATKHTVPSVSYIIWERRNKLKPEFQHLSGPQIRDLRLSGQEITHEVRMPSVAYTGDTSSEGLDQCEDLYRADVLITEMTFVAPGHRRDKIKKHGHMHVDDFVQRQDRFQNQLIIASHFSTRYSVKQVERLVDKALPGRMNGRLKLWL